MKAMLAVLALMLASVATAQTEGVNFVEGKSLAQVMAQAKKEGKLTFVDCYTTWCGPCKMMANREFPKKEAGDYFNAKFVCAKYDIEAGEGIELAKKYDVRSIPTFLIFNTEGELIHRMVGANEIGEFIKSVEDGLKQAQSND